MAAVVVLLSAPALAWGDALTPESGGSPNADAIDSLYKIVLYVAVAVFVGVEGTLVYFLARYRARRGRLAAQIHGNTRLEIGWTVGAVVIVVVLTIVTFTKLGAITNPDSAPLAVAAPIAAWDDARPNRARAPALALQPAPLQLRRQLPFLVVGADEIVCG